MKAYIVSANDRDWDYSEKITVCIVFDESEAIRITKELNDVARNNQKWMKSIDINNAPKLKNGKYLCLIPYLNTDFEYESHEVNSDVSHWYVTAQSLVEEE